MNNKIRVARAELRMTQQQLAEAAGVSRQTINAIESGKFVPSTVLHLQSWQPDFLFASTQFPLLTNYNFKLSLTTISIALSCGSVGNLSNN